MYLLIIKNKIKYIIMSFSLDSIFFILNNNNYFIGLMMILLNLGTKYLMQEFGMVIDYIFNQKLIRRLVLFTVFFVATRNIKVSIILTGIIIILTMELFNEKSQNCILPKKWLEKFTNKDKFSKDEINNAIYILKKSKIIK
jgi:hypothetical protein